MKTCGDIMTLDPTCCLSSDTAAHAAKLMKDENVGSIPVIKDEYSRILVGIVTDRDLTLQVVAEERDAHSVLVQQVMTSNPVVCHSVDTLEEAMQAMSDHQVRRIPVVNNENEILGIISQADIATRVNQPQETADVLEEISKPAIMAEKR